jgi:HD-GYP domain-containing protein (c-di-GMP phosphodiesterase class II)
VPRELIEKTDERRFSLPDQAGALAVVLREEFGVSFCFYDATSGAAVAPGNDAAWQDPEVHLEPATVLAVAADGRVLVTAQPDRQFQICLLLYAGRQPVLVAAGQVAGFGANGSDEDRARELSVLQRWAQAVSDRLRLGDQLLSRRRAEEAQQAQATAAWEALLAIDQVARRLRIHKDPARNHQRILETAAGSLPVQTLVWVPQASDEPVLFQGEPGLTQDECRQLIAALAQSPEYRPPAPVLCNQVQTTFWGPRFPSIENLMAFQVADQGPVGWFVAINKKGAGSFRRSDAALLLPFVALLELHLRWSHRYQDLKDLLVGLTRSLTTALDAKDTYTYGHSERVARIAVELGRELGLEGDELGDLYLAGLLHDVGKIGIKDTVLHKQGPLTPEEQEHIQQHVTIGYWILAELKQIRNLLPGVLYHHERVDGTGYPDKLAGENIPRLARILAVADAYDAMSHQRPYRDSMPYKRVEEILIQGAGTQWDKQVVDAFLRCRQRIHIIRQRGVGDSLRQAIDGALRSQTGSLRSTSGLPQRPGLLGAKAPVNDR